MGVSLKPEHLKRYKDVALLLLRYGHGDLVSRAGLTDLLPEDHLEKQRAAPQAAEFAADLEQLGPTFIKLGQLLSTRPDIVPPAYADALARLQDRCAPVAFSEIEAIIAE